MESAANKQALAMIDRWPDWQHWALIVHGPAHSGKSHLASVWRYKTGAASVPADALDASAVDMLKRQHALVVENLETGVADEQMLFHLLNLAREHKYSILLTSRIPPGELAVTFPDLRSRLRALPMIGIDLPDDALLKAVLVKLFADRQLSIEPHVVNYIALHMHRSFENAHTLVAAIDQRALAAKRRVTRALAGEVIADLQGVAGQFEAIEPAAKTWEVDHG
jgi:chromosomal replication initiation ATPase DnaA